MMLATKEQAIHFWCPMVRQEPQICHGGPINRPEAYSPDMNCAPSVARCIADKCAMWRWVGSIQQAIGAPPQFVHHFQPAVGYCGLAGAIG